MSDVIDMKVVLERAAMSPDPAVRSAATHYYKLRKQIEEYDGLFAFLARAYAEVAATAPVKPKPAAPVSRKPDLFFMQVRDLLVKHGSPMRMNDLFTAYWEKHPHEDKTSPETFRGRLNKKRDKGLILFEQGHYRMPQENGLAP